MILDNEEQREILLMMIDSINIPGRHLDKIFEIKQIIKNAEVEKVNQ